MQKRSVWVGVAICLIAASGCSPSLDGGPENLATQTAAETQNAAPPVGIGFATSAAMLGDINQDGFSDFAVGAPLAADGGSVFVYLGSAGADQTGGLALAGYSMELKPVDGGARFGQKVSPAGDVNNDGYSDFLVADPAWTRRTLTTQTSPDGGGTITLQTVVEQGKVYLYLGGPSGPDAPTIRVGAPGSDFGSNIAMAGDFDSDGFDDFLVSMPGTLFPSNPGVVQVYRGVPSPGAQFQPFVNLTGATADGGVNDTFGSAMAGLGSMFGTLDSDIAIGSPGEGPGVVRFYRRTNVSGLTVGPAVTMNGAAPNEGFGSNLACITDWSGTVPRPFELLISSGGLGKATTVSGTYVPSLNVTSTITEGWQNHVASAGDFNGDGYADFVLASKENSTSMTGTTPQVKLFKGGALGTQASVISPQQGALVPQYATAGSGDLNGDGFSDVVIADSANETFTISWGGVAAIESQKVFARPVGQVVANAGDVSGDGLSDIIVGDPGPDGGTVLIHSNVLATPLTLSIGAPPNVVRFGEMVGTAGDVNGDGLIDMLMVGRTRQPAAPRVALVYVARPNGGQPAPWWSDTLSSASAQVTAIGDFNADGFEDLALAEPDAASTQLSIVLGTPGSPSTLAPLALGSSPIGLSLAAGGDVNGDGFADVVLGFPHDNGGVGRVRVVQGGVGSVPGAAIIELTAPTGSTAFGTAVAGIGDFNGDGFSDLAVASGGAQSAVWVFAGSSVVGTPLAEVGSYQLPQIGPLTPAGDLDGDGLSDFVVGFPNGSGSGFSSPLKVFLGRSQGLSASTFTPSEFNMYPPAFGSSVGGGGDLNGDGFSDLLLGVPGSGINSITAYLGGAGLSGHDRSLEQVVVGSGPGPNSRVPLNGAISLVNGSKNSLGWPEKAKFQFEVKRVAERFDGGGLLPGQPNYFSWQATGMQGGYHWRSRVVSGPNKGRWVSFGANPEWQADFFVGPPPTLSDAGVDAGPQDSGAGDGGGPGDAGTPDAGTPNDGGPTDAGTPNDAGPGDAGLLTDGGATDAGSNTDAGSSNDAGTTDAGTTDAGTTDAGSTGDAGTADAGTGADAGSDDAGSSVDDAGSGVDAGQQPDSGAAGDAGTPDAGMREERFGAVGCQGCNSSGSVLPMFGLLALWRRRRSSLVK